jgi:hypothetical protein
MGFHRSVLHATCAPCDPQLDRILLRLHKAYLCRCMATEYSGNLPGKIPGRAPIGLRFAGKNSRIGSPHAVGLKRKLFSLRWSHACFHMLLQLSDHPQNKSLSLLAILLSKSNQSKTRNVNEIFVLSTLFP